MELKINDKDYSFKFGVRFVRELDKEMPIKNEGVDFGFGLNAKVIPELKMANINTLSRLLYLASRTEKPKLTQEELDNYIDDVDDIEALFDLVMKELSESNAGKLAVRNMDKQLKA